MTLTFSKTKLLDNTKNKGQNKDQLNKQFTMSKNGGIFTE